MTPDQREMQEISMEMFGVSVDCRSEPCRLAARGVVAMIATWFHPHREYLGRYWMQHRHWSAEEIRKHAAHVRAWFRDAGTWSDTRREAQGA